jgi:hypothetical protein
MESPSSNPRDIDIANYERIRYMLSQLANHLLYAILQHVARAARLLRSATAGFSATSLRRCVGEEG